MWKMDLWGYLVGLLDNIKVLLEFSIVNPLWYHLPYLCNYLQQFCFVGKDRELSPRYSFRLGITQPVWTNGEGVSMWKVFEREWL